MRRRTARGRVALSRGALSRAVVAAGLALAGCAVASACTGPEPPPPPTTAPATAPATTAPPTPVPTATAGCDLSRAIDHPVPPGPDDIVVGPLTLPGLAIGYTSARPEQRDGVTFAKVGVQLAAGHEATLSIAGPARSWAAIATENGPDGGYSTVHYRSCTAAEGERWWVGGFVLLGRTSGCVPLDIATDETGLARRVTLALWRDDCG